MDPKGLYVALHLSNDSKQFLLKALSKIGINGLLDDFKFHTTIMYDKGYDKLLPIDEIKQLVHLPYRATVCGIMQMGEVGSEYFTYAIELLSQDITDLHNVLSYEIGCKHSFDDYILHTSLGYNLDDDVYKNIKDNLLDVIRNRTLTYDRLQIEEVKD